MILWLLNLFIYSLRTSFLKNTLFLCQGWGGKTWLIFLPCGVMAEWTVSVLCGPVLHGPCRTEFSTPICSADIFCIEGIVYLSFPTNSAIENQLTEYGSMWLYIYVHSTLIHSLGPLGFLRECDSVVGGPWWMDYWCNHSNNVVYISLSVECKRVLPACLGCLVRESAHEEGLRTFSMRMEECQWMSDAFLEVFSKSHSSSMILSVRIWPRR